jgi:adenylate kinase family enzyme
VLLIGPINTGKSTLARLLAERLGRPHVSLDSVRWEYYRELAAHVAYTDGKTPVETADEVWRALGRLG